jgi:hypothetical protein
MFMFSIESPPFISLRQNWIATRVTRLGKFSLNGVIFYFDCYILENHRSVHIFGLLYSTVKFMHKCSQIFGWAIFCVIFSQTHLVTLAAAI